MKWVSYWVMALAVLHCILAIIVFHTEYRAFVGNGIIAAVADDKDRLALWFFVAGMLFFVIGYLLWFIRPVPRTVGVIFGLIALGGGILLPASGFWLLLPPAVGIILAKGVP